MFCSSCQNQQNRQEAGQQVYAGFWFWYQSQVQLGVPVLQHGVDALHLAGDATLRVVQALDEVVSVLRHQAGEAEEGVGLGVL